MKRIIGLTNLLSLLYLPLFAQETTAVRCKPDSDRVPVWTEPHGVHMAVLLNCGQKVHVLAIANGCTKIKLSETSFGYVAMENFLDSSSSVAPVKVKSKAQRISPSADMATPDNPASTPSVYYFAPSDFGGNQLAIDLPPTKSRKTILVAVPNLTAVDWRKIDLNSLTVNLSTSVTTADTTKYSEGRPLPSIVKPQLKEWKSPFQGKSQSLPANRRFSVYNQAQKTYVSATGLKAYEGQRYAYYQDVLNSNNFSQAEYQIMDAAIEARYSQMTKLFGEPTDLDGNGHFIVFISKTVASVHPNGQAYTDGCNLSPLPNSCRDNGEIVYFFSPDAIRAGNRRSLAEDYYPRNILHESVHILQGGHSYRKYEHSSSLSSPAFLKEGQAELIILLTNLGYENVWASAKYPLLKSDQSKANPFFYPYDLGAIFVYYLHQVFGEGVSQSLIDAMYDVPAKSPVEIATRMPEPLALAMMYASLYFDDTDRGRETGLQFPLDNVHSLINGLPAIQLKIGQISQTTRSYTGAVIYEIITDRSAHVVVDAGATNAFVLVVQ
jgi:hypothetical protein